MQDTRRTRLVLVVLMVAALALITLDYRDGTSPVLRGVRKVSGSVFGGAEHLVGSAWPLFTGSGGSATRSPRCASR